MDRCHKTKTVCPAKRRKNRGNTAAITRHAVADARMENKSQPVKEAGNSRCHDPPRESIDVEYRGYWFYIDERDQNAFSTYMWLVEPLAIESERVVLLEGRLVRRFGTHTQYTPAIENRCGVTHRNVSLCWEAGQGMIPQEDFPS